MVGKSRQQTALQPAVRYHFLFAWWSLLCFLSAGIGLEMLHAFKVDWYLEVDYETRRLLWTLGHAHGTLLALVHVAFGVTVFLFPQIVEGQARMASPCLTGASVLLPGGFILGGVFVYGGDPGIGVWLVPIGALLLFAAVGLVALGITSVERQVETPAAVQQAKKNRR